MTAAVGPPGFRQRDGTWACGRTRRLADISSANTADVADWGCPGCGIKESRGQGSTTVSRSGREVFILWPKNRTLAFGSGRRGGDVQLFGVGKGW